MYVAATKDEGTQQTDVFQQPCQRIRRLSSWMRALQIWLASATIATSARFIIAAFGFLFTAMMNFASLQAAVCWMAPLIPKDKRICGRICLPAWPTSASCSAQSA